MSPLPTMPHHQQHHPHHGMGHHPMQSPNFGSPGMMAFPSPGPMRSNNAVGGVSSTNNTPGRPPQHMPYMPSSQVYDQSSPDRGGGGGGNRVEQRRNPDGSTSIQIGGHAGRSSGNPGGNEMGDDGMDYAADEEAQQHLDDDDQQGGKEDV